MAAIEAAQLVRRFRVAVKERPGLAGALLHLVSPRWQEITAVDGVSFRIERGERVAYLGPNGAGKSTTIKMLTGILTPTAGEVRVCGVVPSEDRIAHARNIGVLFGQRSHLWFDLPVIESFRVIGDIYGLSRAAFDENLGAAIEKLDLGDLLKSPARNLSLGQRVRCDLAAAMLHRPPVLFLDEPTIGLDLNVKERIRAFIREVADERGTTILLTSHDLGDIEHICRRLIVIDRGKKLLDDPLETVRGRLASERFMSILLDDDGDNVPQLVAKLTTADVACERVGPAQIRIKYDPTETAIGELVSLVFSSARVLDVHIDEASIEDVVRKIYAGTLDDEAK